MRESHLSHKLTNIFHFSHFNGWEVVSQCGFNLIFIPQRPMMLSRFSYASWLPVCLLLWSVSSTILSIFYWIICIVIFDMKECFICFGYKFFVRFLYSEYFLQICLFLKVVLSFCWIQLLFFSPTFMTNAFCVLSQRSLPVPRLLGYPIVYFQKLYNFSFAFRKTIHLSPIQS